MRNKKNIPESVQELFFVKSYVDLAINLDMDNQIIARVKIRNSDYSKNLLVLYQPAEMKIRKGQPVNISTLYMRKNRVSLFGKVVQAESNFFIMKYKPEIVLINLRRSYRVDPKIIFDVVGKIEIFEKERYLSENLVLKDLCITGLGLLTKVYEWDKDLLNRKLNIEGKVHLNFENNKELFKYSVSGKVALVRIVETPNGFLEGYDFLGKKSDDISKIVMDSQIAHKQSELKYYG